MWIVRYWTNSRTAGRRVSCSLHFAPRGQIAGTEMVSDEGRDDAEDQDRKPIYAAERAVLGLTRIDLYSDAHFTWGRNTVLTRLSADTDGNLNDVLSALSREVR